MFSQLAIESLPSAHYTISGTAFSDRVFDMGAVPVSAAKADFSSPELLREATSSLVSLVEILTTLLEDDLALPLDFLFVTIVHCWL